MKEEYFFSVCVQDGFVQAAVWRNGPAGTDVIDVSSPIGWENDETLVTAADTCLSHCVQSLPPEAKEPSKTVFGVSPSWVADGQIERTHLDKIRLICNKLSLAPTGFVVLPEAISHFRKAQEKSPISAIILGIGKNTVDLSVFKLGTLVGTVNVVRSVNVIDDVVEGLSRFGVMDSLPSRFLLYDSKAADLEEVKQNLVQADWGTISSVKFLHTPQIEIINPSEKMSAISLAGAFEMAGGHAAVAANTTHHVHPHVQDKDLSSASALGFAVGNELPNIKMPHVNLPDIKMPSINWKKLSFLPFVLAGVAIIGIFAAWWILPKAQVNIIIAPKKLDAHKVINFTDNSIPTKTISASASGNKTKTTTGTKTVGTPSKGSVTFTNSGGSLTIPAGTTLTSSNLQFTLDSDLSVASGSGAASSISCALKQGCESVNRLPSLCVLPKR